MCLIVIIAYILLQQLTFTTMLFGLLDVLGGGLGIEAQIPSLNSPPSMP
jgi:hypothetical protein